MYSLSLLLLVIADLGRKTTPNREPTVRRHHTQSQLGVGWTVDKLADGRGTGKIGREKEKEIGIRERDCDREDRRDRDRDRGSPSRHHYYRKENQLKESVAVYGSIVYQETRMLKNLTRKGDQMCCWKNHESHCHCYHSLH